MLLQDLEGDCDCFHRPTPAARAAEHGILGRTGPCSRCGACRWPRPRPGVLLVPATGTLPAPACRFPGEAAVFCGLCAESKDLARNRSL